MIRSIETPRQPARHSRMSFAQGLRVTVEFELKALLYSAGTLFTQAVLNPAVYLLLLGAGIASAVAHARGLTDLKSYLSFILPGIIAIQALNTFHRVMWRAAVDRQWGLMALKRVYGVTPTAYVPGMLLAPTVLALAQTVTILVCAALLGLRVSATQVGVYLLGTALAAAFWGCLGLAATYFLTKQDRRNTVVNLLFLPLTFAAPTYYALNTLPAYMKVIAAINPLTYQVQAMRPGESSATISLVVTVALLAAALVVTTLKVARTELVSQGHA